MPERRFEADFLAGQSEVCEFSGSAGDATEPVDTAFPGETVGALVVDKSLTVTDCIEVNRAVADSLGNPVGRPLSVLHSVLTEQVTDAVKTAFGSQETVRFEAGDGATNRFAVCAIPVAESVVVHMLDVTESVRRSRELRKTQKTLDTLEDGIYILDGTFAITAVNDAVTDITGYSRKELSKRNSRLEQTRETPSCGR